LPGNLIVRTNRYLNNVIEQDHRRVKQRVRPMLGKLLDLEMLVICGGREREEAEYPTL